jgi:hypothetical protein
MLQASTRTLLSGLIDYAGLFPPAKLDMPAAVEAFARAKVSGEEWMLGRFICPASKLEEFSKAASSLLPGTHATSGYREHADFETPWGISLLVDQSLPQTLSDIDGFNEHHSDPDHGLARIDMVELKAARADDIDEALDQIPEDIFPFFEFPPEAHRPGGDCRGYVATLAGSKAGAKIRTGGVTPDAFPSCEAVASFLHACASADVAFKATAGLHHPVRAAHRLTYEPGSERSTMHGFLNVFIAAALVRSARIEEDTTLKVLHETEPGNFHLGAETLGWTDRVVDLIQLARVRESSALSFGSCSFDEPVADLRALKLL